MGLFWVTRSKLNMKYEVAKESTDVVSDQLIRLTGTKTSKSRLTLVRRVEYSDVEKNKHYVFITNQMHWSVQTVADIYRSRWEIELLFK